MNLKDFFTQNKYDSSANLWCEKLQTEYITVDFQHQKLPQDFINDIQNYCQNKGTLKKYKDVYDGKITNLSENKSVSHFNYRKKNFSNPIKLPDTSPFKKGLADFEKVIFFGIGGSYLGPSLIGESLIDNYSKKVIHITGSDKQEFEEKLTGVDLKNCLFILASKSFSTLETLSAYEYITGRKFLDSTIAITSHEKKAIDYGVPEGNIFHIDKDTGGRFSIWGTISLMLSVLEGDRAYKQFIEGGALIDNHMLSKSMSSIPFIMALQDIFYNNVLNNETELVLNYDWKLRNFYKYAQQLEMESNGKSVSQSGEMLDYQTSQIVWGGFGPEAQHSFFQSLYQGTKIFNTNIICTQGKELNHTQFKALVESLKNNEKSKPHMNTFSRGFTTLELKDLSPYSIGSLIAIWENKTIIKGLIWDINSFDQWGVELGKRNTQKFLGE